MGPFLSSQLVAPIYGPRTPTCSSTLFSVAHSSVSLVPQDIGRLFIAGFGSSMIFGTIVGALADRK
jgi:hypothetical protein